MLFAPAHHATGRVQPESAAARDQDGVHLLHEGARPHQVRLARAWGRTAHVDAGHGAAFAQHHRAACGAAAVGPVADADAGDIRDGVEASLGWHWPQYQGFGAKSASAGRLPP